MSAENPFKPKSIPQEESRLLSEDEISAAHIAMEMPMPEPGESQDSVIDDANERKADELNKIKSDLERTEDRNEDLKERLTEIKRMMAEFSAMESGTHEKYLASYKLMTDTKRLLPEIADQHPSTYRGENIDESGYFNGLLSDVVHAERRINALPLNQQEVNEEQENIAHMKNEINEVAREAHKIASEAEVLWWKAKGEYESSEGTINDPYHGPSSALMGTFLEEANTNPVSLERAVAMITEKDLGRELRAHLAYTLMKDFIAKERYEDAGEIALVAEKGGFYGNVDNAGLYNLTSSLFQKLVGNGENMSPLAHKVSEIRNASHRWYSKKAA